VRRLKDDPDYDYEIIAGVRRWWTVQWLREHHHPEFDYLVTIQTVTDEEAFRVSDVENRSRKDISDWERAKEYARALSEFYENSQSQMAEHLNLSRSWLSRLLDVARLPEEIVAAFSDTHDITVRVARDIKPLTSEPKTLKRMRDEAERIEAERRNGGSSLTGPEVAKRLVRATVEAKKKETGEREITGKGGKTILRYASARGGDHDQDRAPDRRHEGRAHESDRRTVAGELSKTSETAFQYGGRPGRYSARSRRCAAGVVGSAARSFRAP
jgi:ParB family chromosome partitioning protein